jgi:hypothetical protein
MKALRSAVLLAAIAASCALPRLAEAQSRRDSTALAQALAAVISDTILSVWESPLTWEPHVPRTRLGADVVALLRGHRAFNGLAPHPEREKQLAFWRVAADADTARVVVRLTDEFADEDEGLYWGLREFEFTFERLADGWRLVGSRLVREADGGSVPGG